MTVQLDWRVGWLERDYDNWTQSWFMDYMEQHGERIWYTRAHPPYRNGINGYNAGDGPGHHQSVIKWKYDTSADATDENATRSWWCGNCPGKHRCEFCGARTLHSQCNQCLSCYSMSDEHQTRMRHARSVHDRRVNAGESPTRIGAALQAAWSAPANEPQHPRVRAVRGPRPSAVVVDEAILIPSTNDEVVDLTPYINNVTINFASVRDELMNASETIHSFMRNASLAYESMRDTNEGES